MEFFLYNPGQNLNGAALLSSFLRAQSNFSIKRLYGTVVLISLLLLCQSAIAQEELCAEVKIEIVQELTLERQGFEAVMRITNGLDTFALKDVQITVNFTDDQGIPVTATSDTNASNAEFYIRHDISHQVTGIQLGNDGDVLNGEIAQRATAEIRWLIIPTGEAAGISNNGELYFVGASLSYTFGGEEEVVQVAPDSIVVKPQPDLSLDYFLTEEVNADDAFTPEIESPEPYTLGVRVRNTGYGSAANLTLESAQPSIIDNEQGLAVDFAVKSSFIEDLPSEPTLLLNFGEVAPQDVVTGRWNMESSLSGKFTAFTASYSHADALGGELTSLLSGVNTHILVHDVRVDLNGRDAVKDFLAKVDDNLFVLESEPTGNNTALCEHCVAVGEQSGSLGNEQSGTRQLTTSAGSGLVHIKLADPYGGSKTLQRVVRQDGKNLDIANYWNSKSRAADNRNFDHFLNIFDAQPTSTYTLYFTDQQNTSQPPVIQAISDRNTHEGGQLGFLVQSYDANGTVPVLQSTGLPTGATFEDQGNGAGVFSWFPAVGQAGNYSVTFQASDGELIGERQVAIRVNTGDDRDGDGLKDEWELSHFGNLDRDGSGDFDQDGRTDQHEHDQETDPTIAEAAPSAPQIISPIFDAEVLDGVAQPWLPSFEISNSAHSPNSLVRYRFEVFTDAQLATRVASALVAETPQTTVWQVLEEELDGSPFEDNRLYYWRVRGETDEATPIASEWTQSQFFINSSNDAPSPPQLSEPVADAVVPQLQPELAVNNSTDPDRDELRYHFRLFHESDLENPLVQINDLAPGGDGQTRWQVPQQLIEDQIYAWRVEVEDDHGSVSASELRLFLISTANNQPQAPSISYPAQSSEVNSLSNGGLDLLVNNGIDPEGAALQYWFELDHINTFSSPDVQQSGWINESSDTTSWSVSNLSENVQYFWRAKVSDGTVESSWAQGEFFVNTLEEAPLSVTPLNPVAGAVVEALRPMLQVSESQDPDLDAVSYRFELYRDASATDLIAQQIVTDPQWSLDFDLDDNSTFYWRARAEDESALVSDWSALETFTTNENGVNDPPQLTFLLPAETYEVTEPNVVLQWTDSDPDSAAQIRLFYRLDGGAQVLIDDTLLEDLDGEQDQYLWDVSALLPGTYQILAEISDEESTVTATACCELIIPEQNKTLSVTELTSLATNESGTALVRVQVSLDSPLAPGADLTLNLSLSDDSEGRLQGANYLQFTDLNWQQPQVIEILGVDDCELDGDQTFSLVFDAVQSSDDAYQGAVLDSLVITNIDNEVPGQTLIMCGYQLQSQQPVPDSTLVDFQYRANVINLGASLDSAQAQLTVLDAVLPQYQMQLTDSGFIEFAQLPSGSTRTSESTFTLRYDPAYALDIGKLQWQFTQGPTSETIEGSASNNTLNGTDGDDLIDGKEGNDVLYGGAGNDTLIGGAGADRLYGEAGDDQFIVDGVQAHADRFNGGDGYDRVLGGSGDDQIRVSYYGGNDTVEEIDGAAGSNWIYGTSSNNTLDFRNTVLLNIEGIDALAGNDTLYGSQSADQLVGGAGSDTVNGEAGDDLIIIRGYDAGFDRVSGGDGNDQVLGSGGDDHFRFSYYGSDKIVEVINGVSGNDVIEGSSSNNTLDFRTTQLLNITRIQAGAGNDTVYGSTADDVIRGDAGSDYLYGHDGDDLFELIPGDNGTDRYNGGEGTDRVIGTSQDDIIKLSTFSGANTVEEIDGDGGYNLIQGSASNNTLDFSNTVLTSISGIDGGSGNDTVKGSQVGDNIAGGLGSDYLYGLGGDDTFSLTVGDTGFDRYNGGDGQDRIEGGEEDDILRLSTFSGDHRVELIDLGAGTNRIQGSSSNNTLDFRDTQLIGVSALDSGAGNDTLYGSVANDHLIGGPGSDYLYGDAGDDLFELTHGDSGYDRYNGGEGTDRIQGTEQDDDIRMSTFSGANTVEIIDGGNGVNRILGSGSNNTLDFSQTQLVGIAEIDAGSGNDSLTGSTEADRLIGGPGSDYLYGNSGDDEFPVTQGDTGFDRYQGGDGYDKVIAGALDDDIRISTFSGANTVEEIDGGGGNNRIVGSSSNNTLDFSSTALISIVAIDAGKGNDSVTGSGGNDLIIGGEGSDYLYGHDGDDEFLITVGDTGFDRYTGGNGADTISGTDADNIIRVSSFSGANTVEKIDAKGGTNRILGSNSNNTLDFTDTELINVHELDAAAGNDTLKGSVNDDTLIGGVGSDYVYGGAGDDQLLITLADTGFDRYHGGEGEDTVVGTDQNDEIRLSTFSGDATVEIIDGREGYNRILGSNSNNTLDFTHTQLLNIDAIDAASGNDTVKGSSAADAIYGGLGSDYLYGNGGNDTFHVTPGDTGYDRVNGGEGTDSLLGTTDDDLIRFSTFNGDNTVERIDGAGGDDLIQGSTGNNVLDFSQTELIGIELIDASNGNDTLTGSSIADHLRGGQGSDVISGGDGADTYHYGRGDGADKLRDNGGDSAEDRILFDAGISIEDVWLIQSGNHLVIYLLAGVEKITIENAYSDATRVIEFLELSTGERLNSTDIQALMDIMAEIGEPVGGTVTPTAEQAQALSDARATAWQ